MSSRARRKLPGATFGGWFLAVFLSLSAGAVLAGDEKAPDSVEGETGALPSLMKLSAGLIGDIVADRDGAGLFGFEYRAGPELEVLRIRPSLGVMATTDAAVYGWLGFNFDLPVGPLVFTASTTAGFYDEGDGQDLGSFFVARNGGEVAWRFDNEVRLGVGFHYYSNYGTGSEDPGVAAATLIYSHPLRMLAR
jgi:lipid A 3-O-deacylase